MNAAARRHPRAKKSVAFRTGKKLAWDPQQLQATNAPEAEPFIRRDYRPGWKLA